MRRVVMALLGTAVGTTLLVGLKAQGSHIPVGTVADAPLNPTAGGLPATPETLITAGPSVRPAKPTTAASKPAPSRTATTTAPAPAARTIMGSAFPARGFGDMQVKIVVTGRHIDDIITVQESNRPKSTATTLRSQALAAQSANVSNVSGATYSSEAWKQSLQSAIGQI
jgi:uncharacterized protein with FMN-binding domain